MTCYICNKENQTQSTRFADAICVDCESTISSKEQEMFDFNSAYEKAHALCPECGAAAYRVNKVKSFKHGDNKPNFKDTNQCTCLVCGDKHQKHHRVPNT